MVETAGAFDSVLTWRLSDPLNRRRSTLENIPECSPWEDPWEEELLEDTEEWSVRGSGGEGVPGDALGEGASGSDDAQVMVHLPRFSSYTEVCSVMYDSG